MKLENFISPCRHGRVVKNSRGRDVFVRCGRCPDCAYHKSKRYENLCNLEYGSWTYAYTFTLTYSEANVPRGLIAPSSARSDELSLYDCSYRVRYGYKTGKETSVYRLKEFGYEIANLYTTLDNPLFEEFYVKSTILPKEYTDDNFFLNNRALRYLRKADAQDFIKRLRFHISKNCPCPISFFICGEYGPQTFRPHFHVILYFNERKLTRRLKTLVRKSWRLGKVRHLGAVRSASACSTYVAGYINSFSHLPLFLSDKSIAPFVLHSQNFGSKVYAELRDFFYGESRDVTDACTPSEFVTSVGVYHHFPSASFNAKIFPRCYGYDTADHRTRKLLYSCYGRFRNKYGQDLRCPQLALKVLQDPFDKDCRKLLQALEIAVGKPEFCRDTVLPFFTYLGDDLFTYDISQNNPFLTISKPSEVCDLPSVPLRVRELDYSKDYVSPPWDPSIPAHIASSFASDAVFNRGSSAYERFPLYAQIFSRVVSAFYLSRHFLEFCCKQLPDAPYPLWTPDQVLDYIDRYYKALALSQLRTQYEMEQEYADTVFDDDFTLFYPLGRSPSDVTYPVKYGMSSYIIHANFEKDCMYRDRVKHKENNDANLIFT
ncbi:replication initiator protein [Microvirus mar64]|uniref:Replication initiator protein n=1 Tax=Microvirus mar64 TaxID=2851201 RepID=A0A8F5MKV3_9VIRU|nr:replication initiator protein [Microvirus mar64]